MGDEVYEWLEYKVKLPQYLPNFSKHHINSMASLKAVTMDFIWNELGIPLLGHKKKILLYIQYLLEEDRSEDEEGSESGSIELSGDFVVMTNPVTGYSKKARANTVSGKEKEEELDMEVRRTHKNIVKDENSFTFSLPEGVRQKDFNFQCSEAMFILTKERREYPNIHYFEAIIDKLATNGYLCIGVADGKIPLKNVIVGAKANSFGYKSDDGFLFNQNGKGINFGPVFTEGDIIGCGVSGKTIIWTKNGKWVGGIPIPDMNKEKLKYNLELYPTITINGNCQVTIQYNYPFIFKSNFPLLLDPEGSGNLEVSNVTAYVINSGDKLTTKQKLNINFTASSATHASAISTIEFVCKYQTIETRLRWIAENNDWFKFFTWTQVFEDCNKVDDKIELFYIRLVKVNQYDSDTPKEIVIELGIQEPIVEYVDEEKVIKKKDKSKKGKKKEKSGRDHKTDENQEEGDKNNEEKSPEKEKNDKDQKENDKDQKEKKRR